MNVEPDFAVYWSGVMAIARAYRGWLIALATAFVAGAALGAWL